jgi:hypothetical protein
VGRRLQYGVLRDVLSAGRTTSAATDELDLEGDAREWAVFDRELALRQHAEMVDAYQTPV